MTDAVVEATAKLQLDEETGEMVSKGELKKRLQKRAKKAAKAANAAAAPKQTAPTPKPAAAPKPEEEQIDPDAMFKQGFLAAVHKERPVVPLTRFPPEPNGYLHLGHAKAIAVNFGFARHYGGKTILRFDDTNPEAEEEKYFVAIEEIIQWLGFKPAAITHSSDNFQKLYDQAEKLITMGRAYVCHCSDTEIKLQRGGENHGPRYRCKHAEQDVETNLQKFRDMKAGKYEPQTAFLRMLQDIEDPNPQMWDLAAYRILKQEHFRTKNEWCIYPTYDFAHCLCDSFENITHSLCTTEFQLSRTSYEWLNSTLGVYEPMQREYGRLNVSGTVMSKRKLKKLVDDGYVRGWDDPRLYTLIALRRRGVPPEAILSFINELGVTTALSLIKISRFEQTVRTYLESRVPRLMLVIDPVPVVIEDFETVEDGQLNCDIPFSPKNPAMGTHEIRLTKTIYIDRSDFREEDAKGYFRLAPGKSVGLWRAPYPVKATTFTKDAGGKVTEIRAVWDKEGGKPKTYIQWVPDNSRKVEVRIHDPLFKSEDPGAAEGGFLNDINPNSETIYKDALIEAGFDEVRRRAPWPEAAGEKEKGKSGPESVRFQGMRVAYFAVDSDSTEDRVVLNRIVSLKQDVGRN
ncbi:glutamine--tRNA ligase [Aspergillus brunneoviolaceus CBS 621.78]|uniref:Glutaminyl-tRNA synthetase n=1 Tax=Aspergillus brunneoviolaceus CBS 621.78 TaxID=1450534 RepID=A0ACD1FZR9_9EURO|nr:glutaminyl-tRNA synthetase [Aspergillus brunneoviolaceus CBS 621.78]RAH42475.1 glutaminyl-tRNA synthetase [Aspergillus brunneoviolaceus CBS 621.78]